MALPIRGGQPGHRRFLGVLEVTGPDEIGDGRPDVGLGPRGMEVDQVGDDLVRGPRTVECLQERPHPAVGVHDVHVAHANTLVHLGGGEYPDAREGLVAKEVATRGILVNAVAPAMIGTDMVRQMSQETVDMLLAKVPMGRVGRPEEVAALVTWLASDECSFSTGAFYDLSGGRATY